VTCRHEPYDIEVETQSEIMTSFTAECEKCGARLSLDVVHAAWTTGDVALEPWEEQVERIDDLLGELDDLPEAADDFAGSARSFLEGVKRWAKEHQHITDAQIAGVERWENGLDGWRR